MANRSPVVTIDSDLSLSPLVNNSQPFKARFTGNNNLLGQAGIPRADGNKQNLPPMYTDWSAATGENACLQN